MASHEHMHFVHLNKNSCVMPPKFDDVLHFCMQIFLACVGDCARFLRRAVLGDESNFGHHHQQIDKPDAEAIREKEERGLALGWAVSNPGLSGEGQVGTHSIRKLAHPLLLERRACQRMILTAGLEGGRRGSKVTALTANLLGPVLTVSASFAAEFQPCVC